MIKWFKENIIGVLGIVCIAAGIYFQVNNHEKRLNNDDTLFSKQDDYNSNTDQKIDDVKATTNYMTGFKDGMKEEREIILFEMTLINGIKNKH